MPIARLAVFAALCALALISWLHPVDAGAGGRPLTAVLTGAAEVPKEGDPDGSGFARVKLNQGQREVCVDFAVENLAALTGAHIHRGTADVAGPVVVTLPLSGSGCVPAAPELIKEIRQNPRAFYVNVHTVEFRPGAVRGQLEK